jgi:hypothetical protein
MSERPRRHDPLRIPDLLLDRYGELRVAVDEVNTLTAERAAAAAQVENLEAEREAAERADLEQLAAARRGGKKSAPAAPAAVEQLVARLRDARRLRDALDLAIAGAVADVERLLDEHREAWAAEQLARRHDAQDRYRDAVAAVRATRRERDEIGAVVDWLVNPDRTWRTVVVGAEPIAGLRAPNGEWFRASAVLDALAADAGVDERAPEVVG